MRKSRQQIPPNRSRMDRPGSIQLFYARFGKRNQNSCPVNTTPLNQPSFLHSRQLMREPAFIPIHHAGQRLLPHLTFPNHGKTRQHTKLRTRKFGPLRDVPPNAPQHIFVHQHEGMPHTKLLRG